MKLKWTVAALVVALSASISAHADSIVTVAFRGIVDDGTNTDSGPVNTPFVVGQSISGSFQLDVTSDRFLAFEIGGYTAQPGFTLVLPSGTAR
jgi:hypothetical protein